MQEEEDSAFTAAGYVAIYLILCFIGFIAWLII